MPAFVRYSLLVCMICLANLPQRSFAKRKPNVIFILADDKYESPTSDGRKPTGNLKKVTF